MGNVVNSHRDLKTQLIISHLRKIYSRRLSGVSLSRGMSTRIGYVDRIREYL